MTEEQTAAIKKVPNCVELDGVDGTWEHVVFRVEHPVIIRSEGEDFYTQREANQCRRWLGKYAPGSKYAAMLTAMEQQTVDALIANLYAEPGFSDVSPQDLTRLTGIPAKALRGVLSSLKKKGIVWLDRPHADVMIVYLATDYYHLHPTWGKT